MTEPASRWRRLWGVVPLPPKPRSLYEWFSLACFVAMLIRTFGPVTVAALHP